MNLVIKRYDHPEQLIGIHFADIRRHPMLIPADKLSEYVELGNEIEVTAEELRLGDDIPVEWKSDEVSDEWLLERVSVYDEITRIK